MRENLYRVCRWARGSAPRGSEEEGQEGLSPGIGPPRNSAGSLGRRARPRPRAPAPPRPDALARVRHAIRTRRYSRRTEKAYVHWIPPKVRKSPIRYTGLTLTMI